MEHCKIYNQYAYEELKILKIDRKCIKDCQIISNSINDYFTSTTIRVKDGKLNI